MLRAELQIINLFEGFWRLISFRREKSQLGKKVLLLQEVNKYQFLSHSSIFCILLSSLTFFSHIRLSPVLIFFPYLYHFFNPFSFRLPWHHLSLPLPLTHLSASHSLFHLNFFPLLEQLYVYTRLPWQPEEATWAGGWTKDPETLIHREREREKEWEGKKENQISFLGKGLGECRKWGGGEGSDG